MSPNSGHTATLRSAKIRKRTFYVHKTLGVIGGDGKMIIKGIKNGDKLWTNMMLLL